MIFEYDLVIPAGTTKAAPEPKEMPLARGIIHKVEVIFPPGCHHKVFVILRRGLFQFAPLNPDGQFKGDFFPISYPTYYPLEHRPYMLTAYGWAPDTTYPHTVVIRLGILPREVLEPGREAIGFLGKLKEMILGKG